MDATTRQRGTQDATAEATVGLPVRALALTCAVLGREKGEALLEGLPPADAREARRLFHAFRAEASPVRQAWLSLEFGPRPDADARVRALVEDAAPRLRQALLQCLPPYQRSLLSGVAAPPDGAAPGAVLARLAARLVRESSR